VVCRLCLAGLRLVDVSELRIALYIELKSVKVLEMSKDAVGIIVGGFDLGTTYIE
jgi:hypothetical protein